MCAKFVFFIPESEPSSGELRPVSRDAYQGHRRPRGKGGMCQGGLKGPRKQWFLVGEGKGSLSGPRKQGGLSE